MAFSYTWNATFESQPADTENVSLGAGRIRDHKKAVSERLVVDHSWAGDADDGKHKQLTFVDPLGADPADVTDEGVLYTKDVSAKAELFWKDEDGNVIQVTSVGKLLATLLDVDGLASEAAIASGDFIPFYDTTASAMRKTDFDNVVSQITAASQTQMEAASDNAVMSTPAVQHYHPGHPKAWVKFNEAGTIDTDYGVSSVTDTGTGDWTVNFSTDFSSVDYAVLPQWRDASGIVSRWVRAGVIAVGSIQIIMINSAGVKVDPSSASDDIHVIALGDQ